MGRAFKSSELAAPDLLLPCQFAAQRADSHWDGERRLLLAILEDCRHILRHPPRADPKQFWRRRQGRIRA